MLKINVKDVPEHPWASLKGRFASFDKELSNPDSKKWMVRSPERRIIRSEPLDYLEGEE